MAYNITPSLGVNLDYNSTDLPYWDQGRSTISPALGTTVHGNDGHTYRLVKASAAVAANTVVVVTEPANTIAAGAGAYTTQGAAVANGAYCWVKSNSAQ